jgi:hypothetical protein
MRLLPKKEASLSPQIVHHPQASQAYDDNSRDPMFWNHWNGQSMDASARALEVCWELVVVALIGKHWA